MTPKQDRYQHWLGRLKDLIANSPVNTPFDNKQMAQSLGISERDLFRKVKEITGLTPQKYLRKHRLNQAMLFLNAGKYRTVKETCYAVGYSNASYFVSQFEKEFGKKPLQILRDRGWR